MVVGLEERFVVGAPVARVWDFLVDPGRVVGCVPGGELEEVLDPRTFLGKVRVALGPLTLAYGGRVRLAEVHEAERSVEIVGEAREAVGTGAARMRLASELSALPAGETEVVARVSLEAAGALAELGRGVIAALGHEVFRDFAGRVRATIEADEARRAAGEDPARGAPRRAEPLRAVPLVMRALRAWAAGLVRGRGRTRRGREPRAP